MDTNAESSSSLGGSSLSSNYEPDVVEFEVCDRPSFRPVLEMGRKQYVVCTVIYGDALVVWDGAGLW